MATNVDKSFFEEWRHRTKEATRSLDRAYALMKQLNIGDNHPKILTVVGSKGKGTAALFASAYLAATHHHVVTITSPSFLVPQERIRTNGIAISDTKLIELGQELTSSINLLQQQKPKKGYLSPGGLFTIAGLLHAQHINADFVVVEAGRGGSSDEISLLPARVVAITPIFSEHLIELGGSVAAIVADKCGVISPTTIGIVTGHQTDSITRYISTIVPTATQGRGHLEIIQESSPKISAHIPLPPGLSRHNALIGLRAAHHMAQHHGIPEPSERDLVSVCKSVSLPGRLSRHILTESNTDIIIDAAINNTGFRIAIIHALRIWGTIDHVLISLPDDKDHTGAITELAGLPTTFVTLTTTHLHYTKTTPPQWTRADQATVNRAFIANLGTRILALGTISFVGHMLHIVGASTTTAFDAPTPPL